MNSFHIEHQKSQYHVGMAVGREFIGASPCIEEKSLSLMGTGTGTGTGIEINA